MIAVYTALVAALLGGCDRKVSGADTGPSQATYAPSRFDVGDPGVNFVSFVDAFGSFAVIHSFDRDTDGDGKVVARLGDHGEPEGDWPTAKLTMLPDGGTESFDEFVTSSVDARWVVLRRGDRLFAVSAGTRWEIEGADLEPDPSPCAPARQASIDPTGKWLVTLRADPPRASILELASGKTREVPAEAPIWRADAMPRGWVLLREAIDTDGDGKATFPRQEGSCPCRWCGRFATSVGKSRQVGDKPRDVMVDGQGRRFAPPPAPLPVGFDLVWSLTEEKLTTLSGEPAVLGARDDGSAPSCSLEMAPLGAHQLLLQCGTDSVIWESNTRRVVPVERPVKAIDRYAPPTSAGRVMVAYADEHGTRRVGLLNLGNGGIEPGPPAIRWGTPHPSGWRLVADATTTVAYDGATGTATPLTLHGAELLGLSARAEGKWFVIDPTKPNPIEVSGEPRWVAANGCAFEPHPHSELHRGPFVWVCP